MTKPKSIKRAVQRAKTQDRKDRERAEKEQKKKAQAGDSLQNFAAGIGIQTDNLSSWAGYGYNPITRIRTELEWIHRGSWLGGVAVDLVADDMTRAGVDIKGDTEPEDMEAIEEAATAFGVWNILNDGVKWGRLYGGAICVMLIDGQNLSTPLRIETVGKNQFRGLYCLDRWMVQASVEDLVTEYGPYLGCPKYYTVTTDAPALSGKKIHYSRCARFDGIRMPYQQRLTENLWSVSVLERLYDRMLAFDSTTQGAAQLVYKSYLRTIKFKGLRAAIAVGGEMLQGVIRHVQFLRQQQSIEGITLLDMEDEMATLTPPSFSGLNDVLSQFAEQLCGAMQIPLVRLFGQSPKGFSTGDTDLRMYYDSVHQQQNRHMLVPVTSVYRLIAQSLGIKTQRGFGVSFRPLWQLTDKDKSEIAVNDIGAIMAMHGPGLISDKVALQEVKQSSKRTGVGTNVSQEDIDAANDVAVPKVEGMLPGAEGEETESEEGKSPEEKTPKAPKKKTTKDCGYEKLTQIEAEYTAESKKETHCGICKRFMSPDSCLIVAGPINAFGGCKFYMPWEPPTV